MAIDYNTIQLSGTGSLVNEELTNGATLTITKTGGIQDITGSLTPHGTQTLLLFEVANGLSNQVPGLNKSNFALVDAGGVKLNTVYSTTNFGFLLPKGTYNSGTFTIATDLPTIPANTLRIRAIGVKRSGTNMVELDGAGAPVYNNQYSFYFDQNGATVGDKEFFSRANTPALSLNDDFTLSIWVNAYIADPPDDSKIFDNATGGNGFLLYHDDIGGGKWNFELRNSTGPGSGTYRIRSTSIPVANTWTHLAGTFKNGIGKIYVDSVLETTLNIGVATIGQNTTAEVRIGANDSSAIGSIQAYSGSLQNCSLWSTEFNQSEIDELYDLGPQDLNNHSQAANGIAWWQIGGDGTGDSWNGINTWTISNSFTGGANYDMSSQGNMDLASRVTDTP